MAGGGKAHLRPSEDVLISAQDVVVEFPASRGRVVKAVSGISLDVKEGETLGLVGESGCGKSTTAKALIQLPPPDSGTVHYKGEDLTQLDAESLRQARTDLQIIFQDPISSLNPRRKIGDVVAEPLKVWGPSDSASQVEKVNAMLEAVGINPDDARDKRPHEFSGGQCQRISIARALVLNPQVIICDEPVSALDVSVQSQILNLFVELQKEFGLSYLFISHDLSVIRYISDRVGVMYLGKLVEVGTCDSIFRTPRHPYTRALMNAIPSTDPTIQRRRKKIILRGEIPSPSNPPNGCRFHTRCPIVVDICKSIQPPSVTSDDLHRVDCHLPGGLNADEGD